MRPKSLFIAALAAGLLFCSGSNAPAQKTGENITAQGTGGVTFTGKKDGQCVQITGNDIEKIFFELDTCDEMGQEKEEFKQKINFTLFVPEGTHKFKLIKDGKTLLMKAITIKPEKTITVELPEGIEK